MKATDDNTFSFLESKLLCLKFNMQAEFNTLVENEGRLIILSYGVKLYAS
jgi:hypothetical protein